MKNKRKRLTHLVGVLILAWVGLLAAWGIVYVRNHHLYKYAQVRVVMTDSQVREILGPERLVLRASLHPRRTMMWTFGRNFVAVTFVDCGDDRWIVSEKQYVKDDDNWLAWLMGF